MSTYPILSRNEINTDIEQYQLSNLDVCLGGHSGGGGGSKKKRSAPLTKLTKEELYERAKRLNIKGRSTMSKDALIAAIRSRR